MSCANRNFANVARKLLPLAILGQQKVHPEDSLFSLSPGLVADPRGLSTDYRAPIQKAFYPNYWQNNDSQIEKNLAPLEHVVVFYDRGGDRQVFKNGTDSTGTGDLPIHSASGKPDKSNLDPDIGTLSSPNGGLGLTKVERAALVAFVRSLTDDRVACHSGPFDRPELPISLGHPSNKAIKVGRRATDIVGILRATGKQGLPAEKNSLGNLPCFPNSGALFGELQQAFK